MTQGIQDTIKKQIEDNKIILYMKGTKETPMCGFSARVVQILNMFDVPYETVDVLEDPDIRQGIKDYSNWPTLPQLYVSGEFIGGCDICTELYETGDLEPIIKSTVE